MTEYEQTAFYNEVDSFDFCGGHATPEKAYHYHSTPGCLQEQAGGVLGEHSPLLGWSYVSFVPYNVGVVQYPYSSLIPHTWCVRARSVYHEELWEYTGCFPLYL